MIQKYSWRVILNRLVYFSTIIYNILVQAIVFIYFTLFKDQSIWINKYLYRPYAKQVD